MSDSDTNRTGASDAITGAFESAWHRCGGALGSLLSPLTGPVPIADGEAVFFERGCLWRGAASGGDIITSHFEPPLLGKPALVGRGELDDALRGFIRWELPADLAARLRERDPELLSRIWRNRLALRRVQEPGTRADPLCALEPTTAVSFPGPTRACVDLRLEGDTLHERGLYDLVLRLDGRPPFPASPHSFYYKSSWHRFAFVHATDIHVARRIEQLQTEVTDLAERDPQMRDAANHFVNFNDSFRDLIRYANRLHDRGQLDLILATGDLVDYAFEADDRRQGHQGGNFAFFEAVVLGRAPAASGTCSEELRVPILTSLGNHDYRINPYNLVSQGRALGGLARRTDSLCQPYDLLDDEAEALQGGRRLLSPRGALAQLQVDCGGAGGAYDYYRRRINRESSYVMALGSHRIVVLDSGPDAGIPTVPWRFVWQLATGTWPAATAQLMSGRPNLEGVDDGHLTLLRDALAEHPAGVVVVGIHAPPLGIRGSEFAPWLRETQRESADRRQLVALALRHHTCGRRRLHRHYNRLDPGNAATIDDVIGGRSTAELDDLVWQGLETLVGETLGLRRWIEPDSTHFMSGAPDDMLSDGTCGGSTEALLKLCAGVDLPRPVDLVLCGHGHDRVEYRVAWEQGARELRYFMDFYLENPATYYSCCEAGVTGHVHLRIRDGAPLNGPPQQVRDAPHAASAPFLARDIPPFADPLDATGDPRLWWQKYRPLIVETGPLGPIGRSQRSAIGSRPDPGFNGIRLFQIDDGVIEKGRYVTLNEFRRNDVVLPLEPPRQSADAWASGAAMPSFGAI